uniref:Uncharacterized protein n=1 Tax=Stomoxys calcitrans TaxID=35570 RepID=A0A1I8Q5P6_STOCA
MRLSLKLVPSILAVWWCSAPLAESLNLKFTNAQCEVLDKSFGSFEKCYLKALDRHNVSLDLYLKLYQLPLKSLKWHAQLFHRGNGFRPLLYNNTMDFCLFMKNPKRWMFWKIIWDAVLPYTNLNHTCPINHDVIIKSLILQMDMIKLIPFPPNTYMLRLRYFNDKSSGVEVRVNIDHY